ncbi:MAG: PEGA domain-containing protein [Acetatifactor sp.]
MTAEKNEREWKLKARSLGFALLAGILLTACTNPFSGNVEEASEDSQTSERVETGFVVTGPDSYDSADTAILVDRSEKEGTLTFLNLDLGKRYTLSMDGTTRLYDKYGETISASQLQKGDIVDITFLKSKKHLTSLQFSPEAWSYTDVERYEMNMVRGEVSIGSEAYKLTDNTQYLSEGRNIDLMDLNPADILSFYGIGTQVLTVRVEKGHGYLRLANDENFIGGWIEVGQSVIQRITEDMCLLIPEGSYQVNISNKGGGGIKSVIINRNEETTLDIGDLEVPEPQFGMVLFSVDPSSAEIYIDGSQADISGPVSLEYGLHQMIARAEGYQSITQYIRVGQESAGINVVLEPNAAEEEEESSTDSSVVTDTTTDYYRVYIDAPEGAEVYLDGNYVGISPCSFKKTEGSHVVTLRKTGYATRSYTVQIDSEEKDISYSFAELVTDSSVSSDSSEEVSSSVSE